MKRGRGALGLLALASAILLAGCGGQTQKDDIPTLRVGDQVQRLQTLLAEAGEDKPGNYRIDWSNFLGGPLVIAAETGGSVDVGWMNETPLVFAQAAGSPVKVVAASRNLDPASSNLALVVAADSATRAAGDLKGKPVGMLVGTITQYFVARYLESAGLSLKDIKPVQLASLSSASLEHGVVVAYVTAEPQLSQQLASGKVRVLAWGGEPYTPGLGYLVASDAALADPKRAALIGDFVARVARATRWQREHMDKAGAFTAKLYKTTPEIAEAILKRTPARYVPIDPSIAAAHQSEADLFLKLGLIAKRVDASKLYDNRYDKVVAEADNGR